MIHRFLRIAGRLALAVLVLWAARAAAAGEEQFSSPQDAVASLTEAARNHDTNSLTAIFGPESRDLVSPDPVQASNSLALFVQRVTNKVDLVSRSPDTSALFLGLDHWPFPIPLRQHDGKWAFDTAAGREEILNRRVGEDELATINVCRAYVQAQREYDNQVNNSDGIIQYARHLRSDTGTHDGLYWHAEPDETPSPLGPLIAEAHSEGYSHENKIMAGAQSPYHGYLFKILTRQGKHALGGKFNYIINDRMLAGFALVAWPAQWGNTGVMTFIVNQQGAVHQKNLGPKTAQEASKMTVFDPDSTWHLVETP